MKKLNQLESMKPKGMITGNANAKIEQKCIETSMVFAEDIDDDSVFMEVVKNDHV